MSGAPRKLPPPEFLDACERAWAPKLALVSLVAEAEIKATNWEKALRAFSPLLRKASIGYQERMLRRWPAAHVVATVGVGTSHYQRGTFWRYMADALNLDFDANMQTMWGQLFLANLKRLGLPTFDDYGHAAGSTYVGRILLHTGMPSATLADFFRLVSERRRQEPGLAPAEFVGWAAERETTDKLHNTAKPVGRFLRYGGDFAVDVVDRAFDLLDAVNSGGDGLDVPLPERFARTLAEAIDRDQALASSPHGGKDRRGDVQPKLVIDPFGQGLLLRLPATAEAPDGTTTWVVDLDGTSRRIRTEALLPGISEVTPQTDVVVPGPVRQAAVALAGHQDLRVVMQVIDDKAPLLAFSDDGDRLPPNLPLPPRPTWFLFPGVAEDLQFEGEAVFSTESPLPPGWGGWCLQYIDLTDATAVWLGELHRPVRGNDTASIKSLDPVPGVRTSSGAAVFNDIPNVLLPTSLEDAAWEVTLLNTDDVVVARWSRGSSAGEGPQSIWDQVSRPLIGTFTIRVRGPWGRGANRTMNIIEGLKVTYQPGFRLFSGNGLKPAMGTVTAAPGFTLSSNVLSFDAGHRDSHLRVSAHGVTRTLAITPPHMTVALQTDTVATAASIQPLTLHRETIAESGGMLLLSLGEEGAPGVRFRSAGQVLQLLSSDHGRAGVYRFSLGQLSDTLTAHPQGTLSLDDDGLLAVAHIRPRELFSRIGLEHTDDGSALLFEDCVEAEGLTAYVYATRAPWRSPEAIPVKDGRAALPTWLHDSGPLKVSVRIDDPWGRSEPIPLWPKARSAFLVSAHGWVCDNDDESSELSAYLAGVRELPDKLQNMAHLWTIRALLPALALGDRTWKVGDEIDTHLTNDPGAALAALPGSQVETDAIAEMVVRTGLACTQPVGDHDTLGRRWTTREALPWLLLTSCLRWTEDILDAAGAIGGDAVEELVVHRHDPYSQHGRLNSFAELLRSHPEQREEVIREAGIVPKGLISCDARLVATMEFIAVSNDERLLSLIKGARRLYDEARLLVASLDDAVALTAFADRTPAQATRSWMLLPTLSLGFALAARYAARGDSSCRTWVNRHRRYWVALAEAVPRMVTIDLFIAELIAGKH